MGKRDECDVVIIGSGIGGLTCAAALTKRGKKVLVIEQHRRPGGYVSSFKRKEFRFDGGLESFSSNGIVFPILKELGLWNKVKFVRSSFQIIAPDLNIKLTSLNQVENDLEKAFPGNVSEIEGYFKELEGLVKPIKRMYRRPVPPVMKGWGKFVTMFPMPFTNPGLLINRWRYGGKNSRYILDKHISDERIRLILSSLDYPVMSAMNLGSRWHSQLEDYWYPIGGMQNFADLFVNLIEENGGKVSLGKKVDQIVIRDGKAAGVRLEDGEEIHSEFVVSNTDWKQTFTKLIASQYLNEEFIRKIEGAKVSESFLCVYLGTELDKSSFGDLAFHTSYFPSYDKPFLEKDPNDPDFFKYCDVGITISSLIDESSAPKGKSVIRLVAPAPYDYLGKWQTDNGKRTDKYRELKERVSNQLVATTEGVIPYLSGHIVVKEIATPLTYERYTLNSEGASAGWSWDPKHALAKEFTSSLDSVRTPIENLFTVGHWSYPPGGLPSAMLTGKGVSNIIS